MKQNDTNIPDVFIKDRKLLEFFRKQFGEYIDEDSKPIKGKEAEAKNLIEELYKRGVPKDYTIKQIGTELERWFEILSKGEETVTQAPEYVSSNMLTPDQLAQLQEEEKIRSEKIKQTQVGQSKEVQDWKSKYEERVRQAREAQEKLKDQQKYVKVVIDTESLNKKQKEEFENLEKYSIADPEGAVKFVSDEIKNKIPDIPSGVAIFTATQIVGNLNSGYLNTEKDAVIQSGIKDSDLKDFADIAIQQNKTLAELTQEITEASFGKNAKSVMFPDSIVSDTPEPGYSPISSTVIPKFIEETVTQKEKFKENPSLTSIDWASATAGSQIEVLNRSGLVQGMTVPTFTSFVGNSSYRWAENGGQEKLDIGSGIREPAGIIGGLAKSAIKKAATKAIQKTITTAAPEIAEAAGVGTLLGGPVGTVVAAVGTFIATNWQNIKKWIEDNSQYFLAGGIAALAAGIGIGSSFLTAAGVASSIAGAAGIISGGGGIAGVASSIGGFISALGGMTLGAIGMPILITFLSFPIIVALMLVIINSGAYMVPPGLNSLGSQNQYMSVTKSASPPGPFENSDLPITITYTITITAKKETLKNVQVKDTCKVISATGSGDCPAPAINIQGDISVGAPKTYTYQVTYSGSQYQDSLVSDTVTVSAVVTGENKPQTVQAGASITIGKPPTSCLEVNEAEWPTDSYNNIMYAVTVLTTKYSSYIAKVCSSYPTLPLKFNASGYGNYWGWNHVTYIDFYPLGVNSQDNALYTLAHELGHSLAWGSNTAYIYSDYLSWPGITTEAPYCFYSNTISWNEGESMPESIALYVLNNEEGGRCPSVQSSWPIHYSFLTKEVFNP